jgi:hypothetical protein
MRYLKTIIRTNDTGSEKIFQWRFTKLQMRLIITSALFLILNSSVYSQVKNEILENITREFQTYCELFPREEVFVQSDRDIYLVGEEIRFSIFLFDRKNEKLTGASRIAYFEILNPVNRPVAQIKIGLTNGTGSGLVVLPDTISPGVYTIRSYTNWMKNFMPSNCFTRKIRVYGVAGDKNFSVPEEIREIASEKELIHNGISARIIKNKSGFLQVEIITGIEYRSGNNNTSYIFLQTHGVINYKSAVSLTGDTNRFEIPASVIIPGINQLSVFDAAGKPVCETYSYTKRGDNKMFNVNVTAPDTIRPRGEILINLETADPVSKDDSSFLCISVVPSGTKILTGIEDYLVFGSEFGQLPDRFIETPLDNIPDAQMDDFLYTAKSNWLDWNLILSERQAEIKYQRETQYHYLYGSMFNNNTSDTLLNHYAFLSIPGKKATLQYTVIATDGSFSFALPVDNRTRDLVIQTAEKRNNNKIVVLPSYSDRYPAISAQKRSEISLPGIVQKLGINNRVMKIYKTFEPQAVRTSEEFTSGKTRFYGKPDIELIMADYIKLPTMQEVFFELLPGVSIKSENAGYKVNLSGITDNRLNEDPLLLIDGVVIRDNAIIYNLDPQLVEKIDVIKARYIIGDYLFYGLINIITTKGTLENIRLPEEAVRVRYRDYEPEQQFKYPDYSLSESLQSHLPDFRNTLYWNPKLLFASEKKTTLSFFASDFISDYDIIVTGVTKNGLFISQKKSMEIRK